MLTPENIVALIIVLSLIIYIVTGGADFGGGVWDLFARGKRAKAQRDLISHVLAPIWEANHIWLILVVVLLFVAFPKGYSTILTFLHFPTTIMLVGIVLRGAAFVFRKYEEGDNRFQKLWSLCFAIGSMISPFFLGVILGAITVEQPTLDDLLFSWLRLFPLYTGFLTLMICAYLAAIYLILEAPSVELKEDFRKRAMGCSIGLFVLTLLGIVLSYFEAGYLFYELVEGELSMPLQALAFGSAIVAFYGLLKRRYVLARAVAVLQVVVIVFGWMLTQYPDLITGHLTLAQAAAPNNILVTTLVILGSGSVILAPALVYLYTIFIGKSRPTHST